MNIMPYNKEDIFSEDIFSEDIFEFVVRYDNKSNKYLNEQGNGNFDSLKSWVKDNECLYYFSKKNSEEHKLLIAIEKENKIIELSLKWQPKTFDYKVIINKKTKRVIREFESIKIDKYLIQEDVELKFIDFNESIFPEKKQRELYQRICELEISPKSNIENQQEIWEKWIEAQELIIRRNSEPILISGYDKPINISPAKKQFRIKLKQEANLEYESLNEVLKEKPFNIDEEINPDGSILLKLSDIENGIDRIIDKNFKAVFERDISIGCILKIAPYSLAKEIKEKLHNKIYQDTYRRRLLVYLNDKKEKDDIINRMYLEGFKLSHYIGTFEIKLDKDIDQDFIKKNNITFGTSSGENYLPEPKDNTFIFTSEKLVEGFDIFSKKLYVFYKKLEKLFSKENITSKVQLEFYPIDENIIFEEQLSETDWNELERELYSLDFNTNTNFEEKTLSFDFTNEAELRERIKKLNSLNTKLNFLKDPLDDDFKFKVRVDIKSKKTKKEEFQDKIKSLSGVEFHIELETKKKKNDYIVIGNLASGKSDYTSLVFNLPYKSKDEKKQTDSFLKFIESEPKISKVIPNLRGDQAKLSWLSDAMHKINNPPNEGLDSKPINKKLKEFIFDSSKAEAVFRDLSENTEDWNELKRHELLILNNSQRKAILSALFSTDLALLQGPPGTGKTTVIAEMIWQMIRNNQTQKILLTSETNLAVDNALEKLLNKNHTLVKPIRFGRHSKFEEEGKKYSFERIMKWIDEESIVDDLYENEINEETEEENEINEEIVYDDCYNNAVQLWMRRIADNSAQANPKYAEIMKNWAFEMAQPQKAMKELFKDKYFKYCNVVGSTSSSAGSPSFCADYQRIYNEEKIIPTKHGEIEVEKFTKKVKDLLKEHQSNFKGWYAGVDVYKAIKNIEFDIVITDEASKATPPELLLPMCYGRKNIIIGDHRQLPPMLHDKSFKEILETLDTKEAKELAAEIDKDFVETSQFERLITNPKVSPTIKSTFNEQYRMHPNINNVIKQFYLNEGGLEPGKPIIENADDSDLSNPFSRYHGFTLKDFINPDIHTIWINVDEPEEKSGTSRINNTEVEAVALVLKMLKQSDGFEQYMKHWDSLKDENKRKEEKEIGIISFYGHQVGKLKDVAKYSRNELKIPIRLNTVDKFQGMERNIIIVSTVRSHKYIENGVTKSNTDIGFAKSPQRLNVALSRAKRLLIVVGNKDFFSKYENKQGERIYKNVIDIIEKEGIIIDFKELKKKGYDK